MDLIFCTLFDSNYIDKGLVLYDSMVRTMPEFKLYAFAFDKKCEDILEKENLKNLIVVSLDEFETEDLLRVKKERTRAEYCWTCSSNSIRYVIQHFNEPICTYIDADMMFFSNPQIVFDEMKKQGCSTIIVPHRFKTIEEEKREHARVGSYCVEFNTFVNDKNGMEALEWWCEQCINWCYYTLPGTTEWYGDQKYLNVFPEKFSGVHICNHYGLGIAPWNIGLVDIAKYVNDIPTVMVKNTKEVFPIILYHFESVRFITKHILHAPSNMKSKKLHKDVYDFYVSEILKKRKYIEDKYQFEISKVKRVVTNNPILKFYQKYISPFRRIKNLRDLYWVN